MQSQIPSLILVGHKKSPALPRDYANRALVWSQYKGKGKMSEKASTYFRRLAASIKGLEQQIVRDVIAVEAERIHAENFRAEAFIDEPVDKWPARKKSDKNKAKRALLVKTGTMKGHALKGRTRQGAVEFVFPLEYEKVHNEGLQAGRGKGFKMPKRQFVGESKVLTKRIQKKAETLITTHLKEI